MKIKKILEFLQDVPTVVDDLRDQQATILEEVQACHERTIDIFNDSTKLSSILISIQNNLNDIRAEQQRVQLKPAPVGKATPKPTIKNILEMHRDYLHKHLCHPEYVDCMITHINNLQKQVDDLTARNVALEANVDRRRAR